MAFHHTWAASRKTQEETGYRSRLEKELAENMDAAHVAYAYEAIRIPYTAVAHYLPDFILSSQCIIVETKGVFDSADRAKMLRVKAAHPDLDIRFLFSNPNTRIGKKSQTTYGKWCDTHGFPYAKGGKLPPEWLGHQPTAQQQEALQGIFNG